MKNIWAILGIATFLNTSDVSAQKKGTPLEIVTQINEPTPDLSGIAVSKENRIFVGFPRHTDNHKSLALAELVNGTLVPFPSKEYVYPSNKPVSEWLVSPHGMYFDKDDNLWVIDDGKRAGIDGIPEGAAKVVGFNIKTKKIIASIPITSNAMDAHSHLNDLRVDLTHGSKGTVYIANSGFGNHYSLVVVDIATGKCREVFKNIPQTSADSSFVTFLEGEPKVYAGNKTPFPNGGADGISLSPDSKRLYWTEISGRKLHSISTDSLSNPNIKEADLVKAIKFEGENPPCDGLAEDEKGNIYFGAFEQRSLVKRSPNGQYSLITHDADNLVWPDGLCYRNGYLYVSLGQWNRLAGFNNGKDLRKRPFLLVRVKVQ